jgi:hypothetical protein
MKRLVRIPLVLFCCLLCSCGAESISDHEVAGVVAWANKYPLGIDRWRHDECVAFFKAYANVESWVREGQRFPNAERILLSLLHSKDKRIHPAVAAAVLAHVGTAKSIPELASLLEDEWDVTRSQAILALQRIGHADAVQPLCRRLLVDGSPNCRIAAIQAIVELGDTDTATSALGRHLASLERESTIVREAMNKITASKKPPVPQEADTDE